MRVCWFEPDDPSTPIDWRVAAAILAPLFLNFLFWLGVGDRFRLFRPLPVFALMVTGVVWAATAISVAGPWLSVRARKSLAHVIADSFGELPAQILRWVCVAFAVVWLAAAVSLPVRLWTYRDDSSWHAYGIAAVLLALLSYTGLQSSTIAAKLGLFTSKLGGALLIAALWRVRDGWPEITTDLGALDGRSLWRGFTDLAAYLIPVGLLAADLTVRTPTRRGAALAVTCGMAIPLLMVLLLNGVIGEAAWRSYVYQPSLIPNVDVALYGKVASSALPGRWAIGAMTVFGVARFCVWYVSSSLPAGFPTRLAWTLSGAAAYWLSMHPFHPTIESATSFLANCLGATSAVMTVDWLLRRHAVPARVDWSASTAFVIGVALPWYTPHLPMELSPNPWWHPWLLPCYGAAFVACLTLRVTQSRVAASLRA